jgi:hypothetical protein
MVDRQFKTPDGKLYPLFEAEAPAAFQIYKSDRRKAKIGDPYRCIEALGLRRNPNVIWAYVGSGADAFVGYEKNGRLPDRAVHYLIPKMSKKVRDQFDIKGSPATQVLWLRVPTKGRTLAARAEFNKQRKSEIKSGKGKPATKRGKQKRRREQVLGIAHRPRATIEKGVVQIPLPIG